MTTKTSSKGRRSIRGFTILELVTVVSVAGILTALAVPQMMSQRRLMRSSDAVREIAAQLRYTRQLALSQRQAFTFQYDDSTKQINIIDHNNLTNSDPTNPYDPAKSSTAVLVASGYPGVSLPPCNPAPSVLVPCIVTTIPLVQGGLSVAEISYGTPASGGLPAGAPIPPTGPLGDGISMTALTSGKLNITFQPDGSVVDPTGIPAGGILLSSGVPLDRAMFIYNNKAPQGTLSAISVVGASGRIKVWRYNLSGNTYAE
jgi:prepilin-type N-terminal cleavage/methylation domain-containing protein